MLKRIKYLLPLIIISSLLSCKQSESTFKWNFNNKKKYVYSYSQIVNGSSKMGKESDVNKTKMSVNGFLNIRSKGNKLADLSLTMLQMKMIMFEKGVAKDTMSNLSPNKVIPDMNEKGDFEDDGVSILFKMIFPLPKSPLNKGNSEKIPMKIPFNTNGSKLFVKGFNTLTYVKDGEIDGKKCAILKGKINISDLKIPKELEGEYKMKTTGDATYYFDVNNNFYLGADINMTIDVLMNVGMYTSMKNENIIKIRYLRTE